MVRGGAQIVERRFFVEPHAFIVTQAAAVRGALE
jgi:hypothetical protein